MPHPTVTPKQRTQPQKGLQGATCGQPHAGTCQSRCGQCSPKHTSGSAAPWAQDNHSRSSLQTVARSANPKATPSSLRLFLWPRPLVARALLLLGTLHASPKRKSIIQKCLMQQARCLCRESEPGHRGNSRRLLHRQGSHAPERLPDQFLPFQVEHFTMWVTVRIFSSFGTTFKFVIGL